MPWEQTTSAARRRPRRIRQWVSFGVAAILVALTTYLGYVGVVGSGMLVTHGGIVHDCRSPAALGWDYEAINYDPAADARLAGETDPLACAAAASPARDRLVTADGVRIAAWYIPSTADIGPQGPTVVLAHGWGGSKASMLGHAELLKDRYNVVAFDFRHHGQSSGELTTQGVHERRDLAAVIDWLEEERAPRRIALLGVSMGGAAALGAAAVDHRIDAIIVESTHATLAGTIQARMDLAGYPLSLPGSRLILFGGLLRSGVDMASVDPMSSIGRLGETPVLILQGGADLVGPPIHGDRLLAAARDAGVPAELRVCVEAGHAQVPVACPDEHRSWVLGFLEQALGS